LRKGGSEYTFTGGEENSGRNGGEFI